MAYEMMRVKQAAEYCCVSKSLLDKLRCYGGGPVYYKFGASVVYNREDLDAWIAVARTILPSDDGNAVDDGVETKLYRHYDARDNLLYIGISLHAINRLSAHMQGSDWRGEIARVEMETHKSRLSALRAERAAIVAEKPKYNIIHNQAA